MNANDFDHIAALLQHGEWTTYGDISKVLRGDTKAARAVGQWARKADRYPILLDDGTPSPQWESDEDRQSAYIPWLETDRGVRFSQARDGKRHADATQRVAVEVLKKRDFA